MSEYEQMRKKYMRGAITHHEFYLWVADTANIIQDVFHKGSIMPREIRESKDPHLNDIPLERWDRIAEGLRLEFKTARIPFSLGTAVCALKSLARRIKDETSRSDHKLQDQN